jgi:putative oxidoreductase
MNMKNATAHSGRLLLALYFFLPGIMKFMDWDRHVQLMETHGMVLVPYLLGLAGVIQVVTSLSLFINRHVAICALTLAAMTLVINLNLHDFWNIYEGVDVKHETQNFVKNLAIFAGLTAARSHCNGKRQLKTMRNESVRCCTLMQVITQRSKKHHAVRLFL